MKMSTNGNLSPAGSSTYDSNTMYVGDGTWDNSRNTFLLPNLQGLNFATMQYNGMGNRFRGLPQYHVLIAGHGVIAAITFLGLLPTAIFVARFYHAEGRLAYKLHVYLQVIIVFLTTVVFILGNVAVGPERALSNPHHGVGVAIYVCILVQFLYGWWFSRRERKRTRPHPTIPLKVHIHRLFGRAIALLAFVQIALGLTLYGSPKVLFILYALWGAILLFWYLTLEYRNKPRMGSGGPTRRSEYSDYAGSYLTGDRTELTHDRRSQDRGSSHWGRKVLAGAGLFGAYEWYKHRRERRLDEKEDRYDEYERQRRGGPPTTPGNLASSIEPPSATLQSAGQSRRTGSPYHAASAEHARRSGRPMAASSQSWENDDELEEEKFRSRQNRQSSSWRDRLLGAGAGIAAFEGVKSMFGSRRRRNEGYEDSQTSYGRPSQSDVSRVEAGQAPFSPGDMRNDDGRRPPMSNVAPTTPTKQRYGRRTSIDSASYEGDGSLATPAHGRRSGDQTLRESIFAMGVGAGLRDWYQRRKDRREQGRLDRLRQQELDNEEKDFNRRNSRTYPRPQDSNRRRQSISGTIMTGPTGQEPNLVSNSALSRQDLRPDISQPPLPAAAGTIPSASVPPSSAGIGGNRPMDAMSANFVQQGELHPLPYNLPPPPPGPPPNVGEPFQQHRPIQMPQGLVEPDPARLVQEQSQRQSNVALDRSRAEATIAGAGMAMSQRTQSLSPSRRQDSRTRLQPGGRGSSATASNSRANIGELGSTGSPPVSVKVNVHPDGRHVTLRRLNEEEAAAERAARRRDRRSRRGSSLSSGGEDNGRYRRNGGVRQSSQQPITNIPPVPAMSSSAGASQRRPSELNLPPGLPPGAPVQSSTVPSNAGSPQGTPSGLLPAVGPEESGEVGSPGNIPGAGTDVSSRYADSRKRRRAERAKRLEAARGNHRVEFS